MNDEEIMEFKALKKKYKVTSKDIAEYCDVKPNTVDCWLCGARNPSNSVKRLLGFYWNECKKQMEVKNG